jgi:hypothetical protein
MIHVGPQQTGTPPLPGVYVVRYAFRPSEHYAWHDGRSWSIGYRSAYEAQADNRTGGRLKMGRRSWIPVTYWRTYENDGQAVVDALRRVGGDA